MRFHQTTLAFLLSGVLSAFAADRPNIIFFATDDLCDWVGPLGDEQAVTSNVDKLAERGVVFSNANRRRGGCPPRLSRVGFVRRRHAGPGSESVAHLVFEGDTFFWQAK